MVTVKELCDILKTACGISIDDGRFQYDLKNKYAEQPNHYIMESVKDCIVESLHAMDGGNNYYIHLQTVPVRKEAEQ